MNFKIGDKVRFLNEKGEGIVNRIINKTTVGVIIDDFEIPCLISDLIIISDEARTKTTVKTTSQPKVQSSFKPESNSNTKTPEGISIAFSPENIDDLENLNINVWFINDTSYQALFTCSVLKNNNYITIEKGLANAFESVLIETTDRKLLERFSIFKIDVLFFDEKEYINQAPVSEIIKFKIVKLFKENVFEDNRFISEKAYLVNVSTLTDTDEEQKSSLHKTNISNITFQKKTNSETPRISKPHANNNPENEMEIDIHIEELLDNYGHLTNTEIINVQLKHFQSALNKAIEGNYRKLIVIHGVGVGRLKQEVRAHLSHYENLKVYDASFAKYGFGATEIIIN